QRGAVLGSSLTQTFSSTYDQPITRYDSSRYGSSNFPYNFNTSGYTATGPATVSMSGYWNPDSYGWSYYEYIYAYNEGNYGGAQYGSGDYYYQSYQHYVNTNWTIPLSALQNMMSDGTVSPYINLQGSRTDSNGMTMRLT